MLEHRVRPRPDSAAGRAGRPLRAGVPLLVGAGVIVVLVWRLGTGPFVEALHAVTGWTLVAAAVIGVVTTLCSAWRWTLVARGLGVDLPLRTAVAAYYRSQFLNLVLPGGVLGDVHRGLRHGRDTDDLGRGLRAVAWERSAGQAVQLVVALAVLLLPSPARSSVRRRGSRRCRRGALDLSRVIRRTALAAAGPGGRARRRPTSARGAGATRVAGHRRGLGCRRRGVCDDLRHRRASGRRRARRCGCCRWRCSCSSPWPCRPTWPDGDLARAWAAWASRPAGLAPAQGVGRRGGLRRHGARRQPAGRRRLLGGGWGAPQQDGGCPTWRCAPLAAVRRRWIGASGEAWRGERAAVADRPYTLLSCGMSIDGYLDDATRCAALLSNDADFDRVDAERAGCDAILVGAATVRRDNPRLLVRSPARRDARVARGLPPSPMKVTVTAGARSIRARDFFAAGDARQAGLLPSDTVHGVRRRLGQVGDGRRRRPPLDLRRVSEDLDDRGVRRLMVEGGGAVLHPDPHGGPRRRAPARRRAVLRRRLRGRRVRRRRALPWNPDRRATLAEVRQIGDVVLLRYALSSRFGRSDRRGRARARACARATIRTQVLRADAASPTASRRPRASTPSTGWPTGASTSRWGSATCAAPAGPGAGARRRSCACTASA